MIRQIRARSPRRRAPRTIYRPLFAVFLLLVLVVAPGLSPAQEARQGDFEGYASVVEVQIPVNVVDSDGEPVRGLTTDDFEIYSDGELQAITSFEVIDLDVLGPDLRPRQADDVIPQAARRNILLLFDLTFSDASAIVRARDAARDFVLRSLHPSDLVAVATHSVDMGPRLIVTFTPDRAQLARAIDTLGAPRLLDLTERDPLSFVIDNPDDAGATGSDVGASQQVNIAENVAAHLRVMNKIMNQAEKGYARGRIFNWSSSMSELARLLDSVKGRKHVVYFSEGFDGTLLLGRAPDPLDPEANADRLNIELGQHWMVDTDDMYGNVPLQNDVQKMIEEFQRADAVIQSVDISGLRAEVPTERRAQNAQRMSQDALFWIAKETGGTLYRETNQFQDELEEVLRRSSVTYLLTFQPDDIEFDGAFHRVRVRADLPRGARISYRKGYYAPRPFKELHPLEKSLLAAGSIASAEVRRDLDIDVLAAPFRASETHAYVPVIIEVGGESLLVGHEDDVLSTEFYAYVTNAEGEMRDFFTQMVTMKVGDNREALARRGLKYYGHLDLPAGDYLIRVLARNAQTGRTGVKAVPMSIPVYAEGDPVLLPPFFPEPPAKWHLARETESRYQQSVVYPFTVNGEPYVPAAKPQLKRNQRAEVCLVAYNLSDGALEVDGRIVSPEGELVESEASIVLVERTVTGIDGLDKLLATFRPRGLAAGQYLLEVSLTDPQRGETRQNSIPFTVLN
ncbi:MAG: VWA domain-containing protein [Thermoanaerobaculia bacterium]|nr:VWA domain-containing protein [Thermoanaerobaculia bacterium]